MHLEAIHEFHQFAQTLNFTRAAHEMNLSVSTLSKHIKNLEDELGIRLVNRSFKDGTSTLTVAGQRYLSRTKPWLDEYDSIMEECRNLQASVPPIRIYGTKSCIINAPVQLQAMMSDRDIVIHDFNYVDGKIPFFQALDSKIAEFAVYYSPEDRVRWMDDPALASVYGAIALAPEPISFMVSMESPFANRTSVSLAELSQFTIVNMEDSLFNNWFDTTTELFDATGFRCHLETVSDSPLFGGRFNFQRNTVAIATDRLVEYVRYQDFEKIVHLQIEDFDLTAFPFLIYRRDTESHEARLIINALSQE